MRVEEPGGQRVTADAALKVRRPNKTKVPQDASLKAPVSTSLEVSSALKRRGVVRPSFTAGAFNADRFSSKNS